MGAKEPRERDIPAVGRGCYVRTRASNHNVLLYTKSTRCCCEERVPVGDPLKGTKHFRPSRGVVRWTVTV